MEHIRKRILISGVVALFFLLLPLLFSLSSNMLDLLVMFFIYVILAQAWNLMGGYAGQINLGLAAFFGCGVFITHVLWKAEVPIVFAVITGAAATLMLVGVIGIPTLRLRGMYFAIGTLALAETLRILVGNIFPLTFYMPASYAVEYSLVSRYYFALVAVIIALVAVFLVVNSRLGLAMTSLRDDEEAAHVTGVDIFKCKVTAFAISASLAGLAGGIYAYFRLSLLPLSAFTPLWTFTPLMAASIGGAGTFMGPIIGCLFLVILQEVFALTLGEAYLIVFGILFILVVLFFPYGLIGIFDRVKTLALPASRAR
jgi:branched-chain amino acid transport system permease protein